MCDLVEAEMGVGCLLFSLCVDLEVINPRTRSNSFDRPSSFVHRGTWSYLRRPGNTLTADRTRVVRISGLGSDRSAFGCPTKE